MKALSMVVPVYNEELSIASFHKKIVGVLEEQGVPYEIIYVNDGSTDNSKNLLNKLDARVVHLDRNMGYGAALKIGFKQATSPILGIIDCDGTYDPAEIPKLYQHMEEMDMVIGQRPPEKGLRFFAKGFLNRFASYAVNYKIPDLNSGLRLFDREMAMHLLPLLPNGFSLTSTITLGALYVPYRVRYVPITYGERTGSSKIIPTKALYSFALLIIRTVVLFNPLKFFIPISGIFAAVGGAFVVRDVLAGDLAQSSLLFIVNAFILLAIGLLAEAIRSRV